MHISLWRTYLLWIPTSSCIIFIVVSPAILFGTSNNPMCHIFPILSYIYIFFWIIYFFNPLFFLRQFNHCLTGNAFYHIQHIITNAICQWLIPQQHNKTTPPVVSQRLHPAAPLLPPCCQPLPSLATCLDACCLPPNAGVGHCRLTPGQTSRFDQCTAHCPNKIK